MEFIDLAAQQQRIKDKIDSRIQTVLSHGQYIMGPEVGELEKTLASYVGSKHAISCASGTDALLMALMAYEVGPGDVIFTTPFTFIATAEVICLLGATPVFVDIDSLTFNIVPEKLDLAIQALKTNNTSLHPLPLALHSTPLKAKGIIPIDLFGLPSDYDTINAIANKYDLFVVEDAAQSFGGEYKGKKCGTLSDIACTSFFPAKPLGCYGDGGMCFTDQDELAQALKSIRAHGKDSHKYDNMRIGINGRLDTLQAGILLAKFEIFNEEVALRQKVAQRYYKYLSASSVCLPHVPKDYTGAWAQYSLLCSNTYHRKAIMSRLEAASIPTVIYYPKPLHLQTAFAHLGYKPGDFPVSETCADTIFSLPMYPYIKPEEQNQIAEAINELNTFST
jgi:dTDP-4-amino-4,6-dideoxygalactose transaminase